MFALLVCALAALAVLNLWSTWRIARDTVAFPVERLGLFLLVWCVPLVGALLTNHLLRNELDRSDGTYPAETYPGEVMEALQDGLTGQGGSDV